MGRSRADRIAESWGQPDGNDAAVTELAEAGGPDAAA